MFVFYLILVSFTLLNASKIDIEECTTENGDQGFCRHEEFCVGYNEILSASSCSQAQTICCPRRKISEKKCREYAKVYYKFQNQECISPGLPIIIGGTRATEREFPHMVSLGRGKRNTTIEWLCGGSLISKKFVLTAAHCMIHKLNIIKLGSLNLKEEGNYVKYRYIEKAFIHPNFQRNKNDIALLQMNRDVEFTPHLTPICLDFTGKDVDDEQLATGWGVVDEYEDVASEVLMKVQLQLVDQSRCKDYYQNFISGAPDSIICVGGLSKGKDTCRGDSGGPIHNVKIREDVCMFVQNGVTSYGKICADAEAALYSRVWSFLPWIESIVWPGEP